MTRARTIGAFEVVASCPEEFDPQADAILDVLAGLHQQKPLRDGMTVLFGWSLLTLRWQNGRLEVWEPDFAGDPLSDSRPGVGTTLSVIVAQAALLKRVRVEPVDVRFDDLIVVSETIAGADQLYLFRSKPEDGDCGWSITDAEYPADENGDNMTALRVWQLLQIRPEVLQALCLPQGFAVVVARDRIQAVLDPTGADRWS